MFGFLFGACSCSGSGSDAHVRLLHVQNVLEDSSAALRVRDDCKVSCGPQGIGARVWALGFRGKGAGR